MKSITTAAIILGSALGLVACAAPGRNGSGDDGTGDDGTGDDGTNGSGETRRCNKMDLVFVVDNSGSMAEEQGNLATNFPQFANILLNYVDPQGGQLDFRIAVTTTGTDDTTTEIINFGGMSLPTTIMEHGDNGTFLNNCGGSSRWLDATDANLATDLGCRANVGTSGPGTEMPMRAAKMALSDRVSDGTNAGFLRDDALLGVVMMTDEDDSSAANGVVTTTVDISGGETTTGLDTPDALVHFLDTTKGSRQNWAAGVIAAHANCTSSFGDAVAATRLQSFVDAANSGGTQQAVFGNICDGDLSASLKQVVDKFQNACQTIVF
ncbi:MAG TPA: hypothetical protein VGM90_25635 [Kofleriaceae bacterium]|jgi:hypothetical protein